MKIMIKEKVKKIGTAIKYVGKRILMEPKFIDEFFVKK